MKVCFVLLFLLSSTFVLGQRSKCAIGETQLSCPSEYFEEVKTGEPEVKIFRYKESKDLFFFMSVPSQPFDAQYIGKMVMSIGLKLQEPISWKTQTSPLTMDTNSKYQHDLVALFGLSDSKLLEVKSFVFNIKGKPIALGYVSDLTESRSIDRLMFEKGRGFSDHAAGCNEVVGVLNSITREFKKGSAYCTISAIGAPK